MSGAELLGEVCRFYSWTVDYVLEMPAQKFFVMLQASRVLRSREYVHQCYVSRSANMPYQGFQETVKYFHDLTGPSDRPTPPRESFKTPALKATSETARMAVMQAFRQDTRINRAAAPNPRPTRPDGSK